MVLTHKIFNPFLWVRLKLFVVFRILIIFKNMRKIQVNEKFGLNAQCFQPTRNTTN